MVGGAFPIVKYIGATQITLHTSFVKRWWQSPKLSDFNNPEISLFSGISGDEADWDLVAACCLIFSTFIFVCDSFWGHELILDLPQTMLKVGASCSPGHQVLVWVISNGCRTLHWPFLSIYWIQGYTFQLVVCWEFECDWSTCCDRLAMVFWSRSCIEIVARGREGLIADYVATCERAAK